jgi:hypothetical protein
MGTHQSCSPAFFSSDGMRPGSSYRYDQYGQYFRVERGAHILHHLLLLIVIFRYKGFIRGTFLPAIRLSEQLLFFVSVVMVVMFKIC